MIDLEGMASVADVARVLARRQGGDVALVFEDRTTTFAELNARASRVANALMAEGVNPGERVAYLAKNSDWFFEIWLGAMKAGAVLTPVNFRLAAPEVAFILKDAGTKLLFLGADFVGLADAAVDAAALKRIALDDAGERGYRRWRDGAAADDPMRVFAPDDDIIQLYTSGTTGHPKGVQLTHGNYLEIFRLAAGVTGFNYNAGETVLAAMPQFHVAGTNIGLIAIASGARTVIVKDLVPGPVLSLLERERVNHAFFVPAVILMLMQTPEIASVDLSQMKSLSYGASPIAEDLLVRARARFNCAFIQLYGMTETTGAGTFLPDEAHEPGRAKLRSCGIAWPGIDVKVVDDAGAEVKRGEVGEIVIRSALVMKGYWNKPDATRDSIRDGWMRTGDAAYQDEDGFFFIYDRVKDMIVSGGENIYPAEVENAIFGHPIVADVAVIGVPDDKWGETVKAIVVLKPGAAADEAGLIAWARERVAGYKVPKSVDFIDVIPRNPSGKILRRELRKPFWEGRGRLVG
jgi:acyl-CoA synthetase (AMP-forming)/AMP-acid ligase II